MKKDKEFMKALEVPAGHEDKWRSLKVRLECKLKLKDLVNLEMDKPDPEDDDQWKFKVEPGGQVIKKLLRTSLDEPNIQYKYKLKSKFKFKF